jgi:anaerobic selenocysteine-containing dehydrogenase
MPSAATEVLPSACPLDCPDACSLDVTVSGGRVTKVEGSARNPVTSSTASRRHPDGAAARGIAGGDEVRVWNELGEVRCLARVARDLRPGVGGACFNDARVQVEKTG